MSYYFVNNKYPVSDPNTDLNFNNDILYNHIVGDDSVIDPKPYDNAEQKPRKSRRPSTSDIKQKPPSYNIFLSFILMVILALIVFYMIRTKAGQPELQTGGYYNPHLVMMGPDFKLR
jgi:hypothetical protein